MKIKVENFEGPLGLLLQLIEKEELDITQVSLLRVAEQYIQYLDTIEKREPEMLADFLLIAAKLLYIKSRALLPELEFEEIEDSTDLAEQLRMYKKFVEASRVVKQKFEDKNFSFGRSEEKIKVKIKFEPPKSLTGDKLKKVFNKIIADLDVIIKLPKKSLEKIGRAHV